MKAPVTRREALEEILELEEMVAGAEVVEMDLIEQIVELKDYLNRICSLIYYQSPLKDQDQFLKEMIDIELFRPDDDV